MAIGAINISNPGLGAQTSTLIKSEENRLAGFEKAMEKAVEEQDHRGLKKSCEAFESYFVQTMFRELRKTANLGNTILPKSQAEETFQDLLDEETSKNIASSQGIGLSSMLYKQLSKNI